MNKRGYLHFLEDILRAIDAIERFVEGMTCESFTEDEKTIRAVERELEIIGEAVKKLPQSSLEKHPEIPWRAVAGMRDRLIHHYWETETEILWKTVEDSVPQLKRIIKSISDELNN